MIRVTPCSASRQVSQIYIGLSWINHSTRKNSILTKSATTSGYNCFRIFSQNERPPCTSLQRNACNRRIKNLKILSEKFQNQPKRVTSLKTEKKLNPSSSKLLRTGKVSHRSTKSQTSSQITENCHYLSVIFLSRKSYFIKLRIIS